MVREGDAFPVGYGVTARVEGWQTADAWNELYYSSRYLISGRTCKHEADAEKREVLVKLTLTNDSILPVEVRAQLVGISATWANEDTEHPYFGSLGEYSGLPAINVRPGDGGGVMLQPKSEGAAAIGVECMAARHTAEDTLALTFTTPARDKRYVYFIKPFETP